MDMSQKEIQDLLDHTQMDLDILEREEVQRQRFVKKQKSMVPSRSEVEHLYIAFRQAGNTGRKDHLKTAVKKAESYDNRHGTNYIGEVNKYVGCGCRFMKKEGVFSKSNGLKGEASATFHVLADELERELGSDIPLLDSDNDNGKKSKEHRNVPAKIRGTHLLDRYNVA